MIISYFDTIIIYKYNYSLFDTKEGTNMGRYYSYMRISTDTERQNYSRQIKALEKYAQDHNIKYHRQFQEEKSGKSFENRNELSLLESILQAGDTVVFKDLFRFTREGENGYEKYMEWLNRDINMVFIDNPTVSTDYIRQMMKTAAEQDIVTRTAMESIIKLLIIVELDRGEKQRQYISQSIKDGIAASDKKSGRKAGQVDKMTDALKRDIMLYLNDRHITQIELMKKHNISRNTLKKYINLIEKQKLFS